MRPDNCGKIDYLDGVMTTHAKPPKDQDEFTFSRHEGGVIYYGDNLRVLGLLPEASADLVYVDPPFFTNNSYHLLGQAKGQPVFNDKWAGGVADYIAWTRARLVEMRRVLKDTGSVYFHCDWHASHHLRVLLDNIFGLDNFQNEIIWHYTGGGRSSQRRFPRKHDSVYLYTKSERWTFNLDEVRVSYEESSGYAHGGIVSKAGKRYVPHPKGKLMDDVWAVPIVNPLAKERVGYPTQKPEALLRRIIRVSSNPGDVVLDPFCGSGTTLVAAAALGRRWVGIDASQDACGLAQARLSRMGIRPVDASRGTNSHDGVED